MDLIIQLIGSVALFFNKVFLRKKDPVGWLLGIFGVAVISIPVYQKELWINLGYNAGFILLLIYGYVLAVTTEEKSGMLSGLVFKVLIILGTFVFCVYLYIETKHSKNLSEWQLYCAMAGLWATFFTALKGNRLNIIGWVLYVVAHILGIYIYSQKGLCIIAFFQLISIIIAIQAIKELRRKPFDV